VNIETAGKDPDQAWNDAQRQIERELTRAGAI
jgi:cellobiose transport system substrate-binding protein